MAVRKSIQYLRPRSRREELDLIVASKIPSSALGETPDHDSLKNVPWYGSRLFDVHTYCYPILDSGRKPN